MSQISLSSIFLEASMNRNTWTSNGKNLGGANNCQTQNFSQNLFEVREKKESPIVQDNRKSYIDENQQKVKKTERTDKEVKQSENTTERTDEEVKQSKIKDKKEKNNTIANVDDQILAIISQGLQKPIEEIQNQLNLLGIEVQDLLTEEDFGQFINQYLADGDMNVLLSGDIDIKQISSLFDELTTFANQMIEEVQLGDLNDNDQNTVQELIMNQVVDNQQEHQTIKQQEQVTDGYLLNPSLEEGQIDSGLGITVPIHNFTTTSFTQNYGTNTEVVTQTITKQTINGKAFIEQVDFKVLSQTKEIHVSLSPKELGEMNIKIIEQNGSMVAEIKVNNEKSKAFILNEIDVLKDSLEEQGLNVAEVKVDIRQENQHAQMEQEKQKSSKRIQEIISKHMGEEELEEEVATPIVLSESEVDYMV